MKAPLTRTLRAGDAVGGRAQAGERVGQLVVAVEAAVGDHQRQVALAARQRQRGLELVVDDPHPGQAAPGVRGGAIEAVVVVPLERRAFRLGRPRSGRRRRFWRRPGRAAGRCRTAAARGRGGCGRSRRPAATWSGRPAGRRTGCGCGRRGGGPRARRRGRQLVAEGDLGPLAGRPAHRRPGEGAAVGPQPRLGAGQDLRLRLADRDLELRAGQLARDRQPRPEGDGRQRRRGLPRERQRPRPAAAQRQQRGEGAAAEGAEESSAPQARRR